MRITSRWVRRQIASALVMFLVAPFAMAAQQPPQQQVRDEDAQSTPAIQDKPQDTDDQAKKPDSNATQPENQNSDSPSSVRSQVGDQNGQSGTEQPGSSQEQNGASKPVGTAAAPYEKTTGVTASRPAGAVIAPAKQRRARIILIRFGLIVGGAVAIGTVVALSSGSPSRP